MTVVRATYSHAGQIAKDLRQVDRQEIWASHHETPEDALPRAISRSQMAWTILWDNQPAAMFGVAPATALSDVGVIWLLGTPLLEKFSTPFLRFSKHKVKEIRRHFSRLVNHVDARNAVSLEWVRWLGFTVHPPEPYGIEMMPFCKIEMSGETEDV